MVTTLTDSCNAAAMVGVIFTLICKEDGKEGKPSP